MRVTFLGLGYEQLGISQLSSVLKERGHEVGLAYAASLFDDRFYFHRPELAGVFDDRTHVVAEIVRQQPRVLALGPLTSTYHWMLGVAGEVRRALPGLRVVAGGPHVSAVPDRVLARDEIDDVIVGEGEEAFPALLAALESGELGRPLANVRSTLPDGTVVAGPRSGFLQDLDRLPFFDKTLWEEHLRIADEYWTMASRGCPYRCTFCFNSYFARLPDGPPGRYVRPRGVDHVLGELAWATRRYGRLRLVNFQDDIFTVDKGWLRAFLTRYRTEIGSPFRCLSHPRYVDEDVARWLAEAGCQSVQLGIQSLDEDFKFRSLKRYERTSHIEEAIDALHRHRIHVQADHILGLPGEPPDAQEQAREVYSRHTPERISIYWATYFPGTVLVDQGVDLGLLGPGDVEDIEEGRRTVGYHEARTGAGPSVRAYELLFRLYPRLPATLRPRLRARHLRPVPGPVVDLIAAVLDLTCLIGRRRYQERALALHYLRHLRRWLDRTLRVRSRVGRAPTTAGPPPVPVPAT